MLAVLGTSTSTTVPDQSFEFVDFFGGRFVFLSPFQGFLPRSFAAGLGQVREGNVWFVHILKVRLQRQDFLNVPLSVLNNLVPVLIQITATANFVDALVLFHFAEFPARVLLIGMPPCFHGKASRIVVTHRELSIGGKANAAVAKEKQGGRLVARAAEGGGPTAPAPAHQAAVAAVVAIGSSGSSGGTKGIHHGQQASVAAVASAWSEGAEARSWFGHGCLYCLLF